MKVTAIIKFLCINGTTPKHRYKESSSKNVTANIKYT